jgi:hypothetical protein
MATRILQLTFQIMKVLSNELGESGTEPRMTEPRKTEPRKTERRMTEPRMTDPRMTEPRIGPNLE